MPDKRHKTKLIRKSRPRDRALPSATPPMPKLEKRDKAVVAVGDGLGNVIEQTPMIAAVAALFKETHVWLPRSAPDIGSLLDDMPGVLSVSCEWRAAYDNADVLVAAYHARPQSRIKAHAGIRRKIHCDEPLRKRKTEADVCMAAAHRLGFDGPRPAHYVGWDPWPSPDDHAEGPLVALSTGRNPRAVWRHKAYDPAKYADVVERLLLHRPSLRFVQAGLRRDELIEHPRVLDCRGQGTLRQTAGLIRQCALMIGNDTGLCHLSAAVGVPTVVVFGPTEPVKCLPPNNAVGVSLGLPCQPCQGSRHGMNRLASRQHCDGECVKQLEAWRIVEQSLKLLGPS